MSLSQGIYFALIKSNYVMSKTHLAKYKYYEK